MAELFNFVIYAWVRQNMVRKYLISYMDSTLRTKLVYKVPDSFESTRTKINKLLLKHLSGKIDDKGAFTYQANFFITPNLFNNSKQRVVYGKGHLEEANAHTFIHFTICPNLIFVFFVLLIFPVLTLIAIFDNGYLIPGGKHNIWTIIQFFLIVEGITFAMILISTHQLRKNFERRFGLSFKNR